MDFLSSIKKPPIFASLGEEIARRVASGDSSSFLYILPTGAWARQEITRVVEIAAPRTVAVPHLYSMQEFIGKLHAKLQPFKRVITSAESAVLTELAIRDLFKAGTLRYYQERTGRAFPLPQGTFEELVSAIATLKERGVTVALLREDILRKEKQSQDALETTELRRLRDLTAIYERYEEKLGEGLTDENGQYLRIMQITGVLEGMKPTDEFTALFKRTFPEVKEVFVETFIRMADPARLICNACRDSANVYFGFDRESSNPELFELQEQFVAKQESEGLFLIQNVTTKKHPFADTIRKNLFSRNTRKSSNKYDASGFIEASSAPTIRGEFEQAARTIKKLLLSDSVKPQDICVAMYRQDGFASIAVQVFEEYGIPINSTERRTLAEAPIFVALDSLFRLAEFRLSVSEVLRLLHSPYLEFRHTPTETIDTQNLIDVIREFRLTSGAARWSDEMYGQLERLRSLSAFDDEFDERKTERSIARLERGVKDIKLIEEVMESFMQPMKPKDFFEKVRNVLKDFSLKERLLHSPDRLIAANALELDTRSYAALTETIGEVEQLIRSLGISDTPQKTEYYGERIRTAALKKRFAPRAEPGSGIMVTSFDQTAGYDFEHLFLIGLNDDVVPSQHSISVTAPSEYQLSEDEHLLSERFAYYQLLLRAKGKLYLSWRSSAAGGKTEKLPSVFVDALKRVVSFAMKEEQETDSILSSRELAQLSSQYEASSKELLLPKESVLSGRDNEWLRSKLSVSLATAKKRVSGEASDVSGFIDPAYLPQALAERLLAMRERTYSVSQLESYARCPFQFFSHYLMDLGEAPEVEVEEGMESSERGILLHRQLQKMLEKISEEGKDFREMNIAEFKSYDPYSGEALETLLSQPGARHPFWRIDLDTLYSPAEVGKGVLDKFLEAEQKNKDIKTHPVLFEKEFERSVIDDEGRTFKIRGKIDRIDIDSDNSFYTVTDYKTSRGAEQKDIKNGLSLQLPLYLRIAEDLLKMHVGSELAGVGAFYHKLTGKESGKEPALLLRDYADKAFEQISKSKKKGIIESAEELESVIATTIRYANSYIDGITRGEFPLVREDGTETCKHCDYKRACRLYEAQENGTLRPAKA
jgi:ATP-dependent helicase/nuclease subunit B